MISALCFEFVRLRTIRSTWVLAFFALVLSGLLAWALAYGTNDDRLGLVGWEQTIASAPSFIAPLLLSIIGVLCFGHEYRYGTIRPTLTALPRRMPVLIAKTIVCAAFTAVISALCVVLTFVIARVIYGSSSGLSFTSGDTPRIAFGVVIYSVLNTLLALALAGILRNQIAAIVVLLVWPLVIETVIVALLRLSVFKSFDGIAPYLPYQAGGQLFSSKIQEVGDSIFGFAGLSPLGGGLVFGAYALVALIICALTFTRRDA